MYRLGEECGRIMITNLVFEDQSKYGKTDFDGLWKKVIYELFEEFILFCIPDLHEAIDWQNQPEFLQQELFKEIIEEKKGKQVADQIVKVFLKDGKESWLLIHIEVQGNIDSNFPERMFRYYYRIFDKFEQDVVAIALLTDSSKHSHPEGYHYSLFGTSVDYDFNVIKFMDYDEADLLASSNPFALALLAGKYASETKDDDRRRFLFKVKLIRLILSDNFVHEEEKHFFVGALLHFIDYLLKLPKDLTEKLREEIILNKEVRAMKYLDKNTPLYSWEELEEIRKQEGIQVGKREKEIEFVVKMLKDGIPLEFIKKYTQLTLEEIENLRKTL